MPRDEITINVSVSSQVDELVPPRPLVGAPVAMPTVPPSLVGPLRPFVSGGQSSLEPIPHQVLSKWTETAATIISNTTTGDSAAMTALGDRLVANGWPEAAHAWYDDWLSIHELTCN